MYHYNLKCLKSEEILFSTFGTYPGYSSKKQAFEAGEKRKKLVLAVPNTTKYEIEIFDENLGKIRAMPLLEKHKLLALWQNREKWSVADREARLKDVELDILFFLDDEHDKVYLKEKEKNGFAQGTMAGAIHVYSLIYEK